MKKLYTVIAALVTLTNTATFAQWVKLNKPDNSPFNASHSIFSNKGTLYAGFNAGIYTSTDDGSSWTLVMDKTATNGLVVTGFAATANSVYGIGVSGSYPVKYSGQTWTIDSTGFEGGEMGAIYADDNRIFAATVINTKISLFTKLDTETSWTPVNSIPVPNVVRGVFTFGGKYYAVTSHRKIFTSTDGVNFTETSATLPVEPKSAKASADAIYVATGDGLYKSADGAAFTRIDKDFAKFFGLSTIINAVHINGNTVYAALQYTDSAYKSTDGGTTWGNMSDGDLSGFIHTLTEHKGAIYASHTDYDNGPILRYGTPTSGLFNKSIGKLNITAYPNPASSVINIDVKENARLNLYNLNGALLLQNTGKILDVSSFAKGIYLLQVTTNEGTATQKIIVE